MKWFKKLFRIIRKCKCGNEYHKNNVKRINTGKLDIKFYRDYSGKLRMSTNSIYRECCEECFKNYKVEEDLKHGITPEMRVEAEEFKQQKIEQWMEVKEMISEWKKKGIK